MRIFEDPYFHDLLNSVAFYATGGKVKTNIPHLTKNTLTDWINAEFSVFLVLFGFIIGLAYKQAGKNPFSQFIHDGVTMANHEKYQALGIQFIVALNGVLLQMVLCIGFIRSKANKDSDLCASFGSIFLERTHYTIAQIVNKVTSDAAAVGLAKYFNLPGDKCLMHTGNKLGEAGMGDLVRSSGVSGDGKTAEERQVNPFPEGQALKRVAQNAAKHFRNDKNRQKMNGIATLIQMTHVILLALNFNTTRVAAVHLLIFSVLRMHPVLVVYARTYPRTISISDEQWLALAQTDAILSVLSKLTTLAQTEKLMVGVYGTVVLFQLVLELWAPTMEGVFV